MDIFFLFRIICFVFLPASIIMSFNMFLLLSTTGAVAGLLGFGEYDIVMPLYGFALLAWSLIHQGMYFNSKRFVVFLLIILALLSSFILSISLRSLWGSFFMDLLLLLFVFFLPRSVFDVERKRNDASLINAGTTWVVSLLLCFDLILNLIIMRYWGTTGWHRHPIGGGIAVGMLPLCYFLYFRGLSGRFSFCAQLFVALITIFLGGIRSYLLMFLLPLGIYSLPLLWRLRLNVLSLLLIVMCGVALIVNANGIRDYLRDAERPLPEILSTELGVRGIENRVIYNLLFTGWNWLSGVGIGRTIGTVDGVERNIPVETRPFGYGYIIRNEHIHNWWLSLLYYMGIWGGLLIFLVVAEYVLSIRYSLRGRERLLLLAYLMGFLMGLFFRMPLFRGCFILLVVNVIVSESLIRGGEITD